MWNIVLIFCGSWLVVGPLNWQKVLCGNTPTWNLVRFSQSFKTSSVLGGQRRSRQALHARLLFGVEKAISALSCTAWHSSMTSFYWSWLRGSSVHATATMCPYVRRKLASRLQTIALHSPVQSIEHPPAVDDAGAASVRRSSSQCEVGRRVVAAAHTAAVFNQMRALACLHHHQQQQQPPRGYDGWRCGAVIVNRCASALQLLLLLLLWPHVGLAPRRACWQVPVVRAWTIRFVHIQTVARLYDEFAKISSSDMSSWLASHDADWPSQTPAWPTAIATTTAVSRHHCSLAFVDISK